MINRFRNRLFFCCEPHWSCFADNLLHAMKLHVGFICNAHDRHIIGDEK